MGNNCSEQISALWRSFTFGSKGQNGITWQFSHLGVQVKKMFYEESSSVIRLLKAAAEPFSPLLLRGNFPEGGNSLVFNPLQFLPLLQKPNVRCCLGGENINNIQGFNEKQPLQGSA